MTKTNVDAFVTLERYTNDLSCFQSKNDFIKNKIENFMLKQGFCLSSTEISILNNILELLATPADFFISDHEWKKAGK